MYDFIIKNAMIADGGGDEPFKGAVAVLGNTILAVEPEIADDRAETVIDAGGLMLSSGFIDAHGHSDISLLAAPEAIGKITQGITTEIAGNCGLSVFPVTDKNREHLQELFSHYNVKIDWNNVSEYAAELAKCEPAINLASLCGHNTLRASVLGYENVLSESKDLELMEEGLRNSLKNGAIGFSTGLLYVPGKFADRNELYKLERIVAESEKIWTSHMRSEGNNLLEAMDELLGIAKKAKCGKVHISHLKTAGKANWHKLDDAFLRISQAGESGLELTADRYPYIESMTQLSAYMPSPYSDMDDIALMEHLQDSANFAKFIAILDRNLSNDDWERRRLVSTTAKLDNLGSVPYFDSEYRVRKPDNLGSVPYFDSEYRVRSPGPDPKLLGFAGRNFIELAEMFGMPPSVICAELLKHDAPGTMASSKGMSAENMMHVLKQPYVCCCTDESARPEDFSLGRSHPRGFGSFPEFFRLMQPLLGAGETIRKMTSLPAEIFGLEQRGRVVPGYYADFVLFNPEKMCHPVKVADFANPHTVAEGIEKVWVNGVLTCENSEMTGERNGEFL